MEQMETGAGQQAAQLGQKKIPQRMRFPKFIGHLRPVEL
jgi:hypothetical protein